VTVIHSVGDELYHPDGRSDGQTDISKLIVTFAILRKRPRKYRFMFLVHPSSFYLDSLYYPILRLTYENNEKIVHISSFKTVFPKSETREHFAICLTH